MCTEEHIITDKYHLAYKYYKGGDKWMIVFHGFGQSSEHFHTLCLSLQPHYSILSVDLFFHGTSTYTNKHNDAIEIDEWSAILNTLLSAHAIKRFSIMGFSIGGRFAVSALYACSKRMDQLILIAPDGIIINPWYRLATSTFIARTIFRYFVFHPAFFLRISKLLSYLKLTDDRVIKFAEGQMKSKVQRKQVYHSWICFRKLKMNTVDFLRYIEASSIKVKMVFGTRDRIVHKKAFAVILTHHLVTVKEIPSTHSKIIQELPVQEIILFIKQ